MDGDTDVALFFALLLVPPLALFFTSRLRLKRRSDKLHRLAKSFALSFSGAYDSADYNFGTPPTVIHIIHGVLGRSQVTVCDVREWQMHMSTFETIIDVFTLFPMSFVKRKTLVVVDGVGMYLRAGRPGYPSVARIEELLRLVRSQSPYGHLVRRTKRAQRFADAIDFDALY